MSAPIDLDSHRGGRPSPLHVRDASDLQGKKIPARDWLIPSVLVRRSLTLFTGDGGVGKSLMCQCLQVAAALGRDWVGLPVPQMTSFGFYCEDDDDELDRRFENICEYYGCSFADLDGRVRYISRVGEDNELVTFTGQRDHVKAKRTALMSQIEEEVDGYGTQLVIIDTAADTFAGNENIRPQVRAYVNAMRRFALINNGGVVLNAHPSKSSIVDGSGFSGSTAWHGSCRNRIYLTKPKGRSSEDDEEGPTDERVLRIMKSNYSQGGGKIACHWEKGVIIPNSTLPMGTFEKLDINRKVVEAAAWLIERGAMLSADPQVKTSLVVKVRQLDSCKQFSWSAVAGAQEGLIAAGKLVLVKIGPQSRRRVYVRPSYMKYPGEDAVSASPGPDDGELRL